MISSQHTTNIGTHESVVLYPSVGYLDQARQHWRLWIQGAVFEPGDVNLRKRLLIQLLRRVMDVDADQLQSPVFQDRIRGFLAETARGKRIQLRLGGKTHRLPKKSKKNGQFSGILTIPREQLESSLSHSEGGLNGVVGDQRLVMQVVLGEGDCRDICGEFHLLHPEGWSVISDIDDTIKQSSVCSRRDLLANTFLRKFRHVDGMTDVYHRWAADGASFHYVSSSPWQLFSPLADFQDEFFPDGSFHLRSFRLRDHMLRRLLLRRPGKSVVIRRLVNALPQRRFVLIGDSGEKDLEIYARVARRFPDQVKMIMIRELPSRPLGPVRLEKAMRGISAEKLLIFRDADELPHGMDLILSDQMAIT
jgi:hypothetical protein